jgi:hypothetical protein
MRFTLKVARVVASVLIGVVVLLWTAELKVLVSPHVCGPSIQIVCGVNVSLFPLWLCALFGAGTAVVVFLVFVALRRPSSRSGGSAVHQGRPA